MVDLPVAGQFFSAYLNGQTQSVTLFHDPSALVNATGMDLTISGLAIKADLPGIKTQLIRQVELLDFGIAFGPTRANQVFVSGRLSVIFELPSNLLMTYKALAASITFTMRLTDGSSIGRMSLHDLPVKQNPITNELLMSFDRQNLEVLNETVFQNFAASLLLTPNVSVVIDGLAVALAQLRIGNISLSNVPVTATIDLVGFDQFDDDRLSIDDIDITGSSSSKTLILYVKTRIINPSVVHIVDGGRLTLNLCEMASGISLGLVDIDPFYLEPQGSPTLINAQGTFMLSEGNENVARQFVSRMVSGKSNKVELRGLLPDNSTGTSVSLLALAVAGLRMHAEVPGLVDERTLVRQVVLKRLSAIQIAGIPLGLVKTLSTRIRLVNPFSASITIFGMNIRADYSAVVDSDLQVGTVNDRSRIVIRPHEEMLTSYVDVTLSAKLSTMVSLLGPLLSGSFGLSLSGFINVTIGDQFELTRLPITLLNIASTQEPSR